MLKLENISKSFPGVKALDEVTIEIESGEVHALVGENGAGKTTLMSIIMGILKQDDGDIYFNEIKYENHDPKEALKLGINMIYQEVNLAPELSISENLYLGRLPKRRIIPWVDKRKLRKDTEQCLLKVGLKYNPSALVKQMGAGERQMLQVANAISSNAKLIIMDEPTASLSGAETEILFKIIRELKKQNRSIIYISHRLEEVFEIADRVTVMRDGRVIDTVLVDDVNKDKLISMMVGRNIEFAFMDYIVQWLMSNKYLVISAEFISTMKNGQVENFYDGLGFDLIKSSKDSREYSLNLLEYKKKEIEYINVKTEQFSNFKINQRIKE